VLAAPTRHTAGPAATSNGFAKNRAKPFCSTVSLTPKTAKKAKKVKDVRGGGLADAMDRHDGIRTPCTGDHARVWATVRADTSLARTMGTAVGHRHTMSTITHSLSTIHVYAWHDENVAKL
jgi:hypothetical protein